MGKPELGMKRTCASCATRFYDLDRDTAPCPKCGTMQARPARPMPASRRSAATSWSTRGQPARVPVAEDAPAEADVAEVEETEDDEDGVPEPIDEDDVDPASEVDGVR
jgi:uncharacterized protein (TIGR02300 family)